MLQQLSTIEDKRAKSRIESQRRLIVFLSFALIVSLAGVCWLVSPLAALGAWTTCLLGMALCK